MDDFSVFDCSSPFCFLLKLNFIVIFPFSIKNYNMFIIIFIF